MLNHWKALGKDDLHTVYIIYNIFNKEKKRQIILVAKFANGKLWIGS